jgi:glycosyltransferase involved in cell wall biosynthesis
MDCMHPILAHQIEIVTLLSKYFTRISVVTGNIGTLNSLPNNVEVYSYGWVPGRHFANIVKFYRAVLPLIMSRSTTIVFSHMVDLQCSLLSPITWLLNKRHFLWYAHTHNSAFLKFSRLFIDKVITSTEGSFPGDIAGVSVIGQAVNQAQFKPNPSREFHSFSKALTYGRLDISKRADAIIDCIKKLRGTYPSLELTIIGNPGSSTSREWAKNLQKDNIHSWLRFSSSVPKQEINNLVSKFDLFFHAYLGSLDKVLIEATMMEIPVITVNAEYLRIFGSWSSASSVSLENEYEGLISRTSSGIRDEVKRRRKIALDEHSMEKWIGHLVHILLYEV